MLIGLELNHCAWKLKKVSLSNTVFLQELKRKDVKLKSTSDEYEERYACTVGDKKPTDVYGNSLTSKKLIILSMFGKFYVCLMSADRMCMFFH